MRAAVALLGLAVVAAACGTPQAALPPPPVSLVEGEQARVSALDNQFRPEELTVQAGTVVYWTNDGKTEHDVQPVDENQEWGVATAEFGPDDRYEHRFTEPGTYDYYCTIHATTDAGMTGTIIVEG